MSAIQSLMQELQATELYTKNKLAKITGLHYTKIKNLLIASGFSPDEKDYKGSELSLNFVRALELFEAGKSLEDIKQILNVATNGHFIPEEEIYTPEEKNLIEGKRDKLIGDISEQLAGDIFDLLAGTDEASPDTLAQDIATKARASLDGRFAELRSQAKRILLNSL